MLNYTIIILYHYNIIYYICLDTNDTLKLVYVLDILKFYYSKIIIYI